MQPCFDLLKKSLWEFCHYPRQRHLDISFKNNQMFCGNILNILPSISWNRGCQVHWIKVVNTVVYFIKVEYVFQPKRNPATWFSIKLRNGTTLKFIDGAMEGLTICEMEST